MAENENSNEDDPILHDFSPYIIQYKDGRFERCLPDYCYPASVDPKTGVISKDISIKYPKMKLAARLYLPKDANSETKHPIVVYFHGVNFVVDTAFSAKYHSYFNYQVEQTNAVTISWDFRRPPEHHLPTAYEDCWLALKWVAATKQDWIKEYGDLNNVYLGGDDSGANIAHHIAMRFGAEKIDGINLCGMFLNCPMFWGKEAIGNEEKDDSICGKDFYDKIWYYVYPTITDLDIPFINPEMDPNLSSLGCKRVLVYVAGDSILKERGYRYKEALVKSGWDGEVEIVDIAYETHCFSVYHRTANSGNMLEKVGCFVNNVFFEAPPSTIRLPGE